MDKAERYRALIDQRKRCACCRPTLTNASVIDGGRHDADEIGAYSRWQGNLNAELMVIGQDFADLDGFCKYRGWAGECVQTNLTLVELIAQAGITIAPPRHGIADDRLFFTNAVLCMKSGGMQASIPSSCFEQCGSRFLRPLVELVSPRVVVTLGQKALQAVCGAFALEPKDKLANIVAQPVPLNGSTVLMPLYHPGRTVLNTSRSLESQRRDWQRVGRLLSGLEASTRGPHDGGPQHLGRK